MLTTIAQVTCPGHHIGRLSHGAGNSAMRRAKAAQAMFACCYLLPRLFGKLLLERMPKEVGDVESASAQLL